MTRLCLDMSAYSHFKRGAPEAVHAIASASSVAIPVIVLGELRTGFRLGRRFAENEHEILSFLAQPLVRVLEVDDEAASIYAEIVSALRQAGTPIPTNDIWIATLAVRDGSKVLTYDEHFTLIHRLGTELLKRSPTH